VVKCDYGSEVVAAVLRDGWRSILSSIRVKW